MASRFAGKVFKARSRDFEPLLGSFDVRALTNDHLLAHYGISGAILLVSYEQVQSLLALATTKGIYILGQNGVESFYKIAAGRRTTHLHIHKSHLVVIDEKQMLYTWDLEQNTTEPVVTQALRGLVTTTYTEPTLDWLFLGMKDGTVLAWDLLAERLNTTFKIKNQYFDRQEDWRLMGEAYALPRYHISPVIALSVHPTDLGMLLITYADGACLFSFKENAPKAFYECIISADRNRPERKPALTCSSFSPDGSFVVIGCVDGTFAFFNSKDAEAPLQVRTLEMSDINMPQLGTDANVPLRYDPIVSIQWCCRVDPTDTFLVIAGGLPENLKGLSVLDYGKPSSKASELTEFFGNPQRQKILPLSRESVVSLTMVGTISPYHLAHNPQCVFVTNSAGNIVALDMPDGSTTRCEILPPAVSLRSPVISTFTMSTLSRSMISGLEMRMQHDLHNCQPLLLGGSSRTRRASQNQAGTILCTIHEGIRLKIYHVVSGLISNAPLMDIDLSLTMPNTIAQAIAISSSTGEMAIAAESGLVVIHRTAMPSSIDDDLSHAFTDLSLLDPMPSPVNEAQNMLFKFSQSRLDAAGAFPYCVISARKGEVTAMCVSDIGFVAIGYDSGFILFVDLRGPAIFYANTCDRLESKRKESVFKKASTPKMPQNAAEYATSASILSLSLDNRLSLTIMIGTNNGRAITFELIKETTGVFSALLTEISTIGSSPVRAIIGCNRFGEDLTATGNHLSSMHMDAQANDCIVVATDKEVTSYIGLSSKSSSSSLRSTGKVTSARLIMMPQFDSVIVGVTFATGTIELFSLPDLQPLRTISFPAALELDLPHLLSNGDVIFSQDQKTALALYNILAVGVKMSEQPMAAMFDALKQPSIPRPTISNWAWVTGTQYIRATDLDLLISGGDRPMSQRAAERLAAEEKQRMLIERQTASRDKAASRAIQQSARNASGNDRTSGRNTYGQMQAYGQERGERVSHVNDLYENVSKASGEWLSEMDKLASNAKKSAGKAALKSFLGF